MVALWQQAFPEYRDVTRPQRNPHLSIANKLATQPELFFVAVLGERIVGTVMGGYDGHRGWLYSLAVDESLRRHGIGTRLVAHVENALTERWLSEAESAGVVREGRRARVLRGARLSRRCGGQSRQASG